MAPEDLVAEIDCCFRAFDEIMEKYGLEKIKTVGDAYLCVGGMRNDNGHEADRVILAAMDIQAFMQKLAVQRQHDNQLFFEARIGIHTGPLVAGIVGIKKFAYDIWGDTVNLASRMESCGEVGRVNISEATYRLVQPHFRCAFHGQYTETEGEDINMYFVEEYLGSTS
jgi:class 3 adenylate cyclase